MKRKLFCGDQSQLTSMRLQRIGNYFAHGAPALSAIELAAMMGLHSFRAPRASFNGFTDAFFINVAADANDHENDLQHVRMIVKNDSQLQLWLRVARNGWRRARTLGKVAS